MLGVGPGPFPSLTPTPLIYKTNDILHSLFFKMPFAGRWLVVGVTRTVPRGPPLLLRRASPWATGEPKLWRTKKSWRSRSRRRPRPNRRPSRPWPAQTTPEMATTTGSHPGYLHTSKSTPHRYPGCQKLLVDLALWPTIVRSWACLEFWPTASRIDISLKKEYADIFI